MRRPKILLRPVYAVLLIVLISFSGLSRSAAQPSVQQAEPVTLYLNIHADYDNLDPQKSQDTMKVAATTPLENLFVGLTDIDPKTNTVRPEAALEWHQNAAGDTWTFKLRSDIPWVKWDAKAKKVTEIRKVTAQDFEYAIKRSCDPRVVGKNNYYTTVVSAEVIKGCAAVATKASKSVTDSDLDQIAVKALSATELEITTTGPQAYFLTLSGMWLWRAVPQEVIKKYGDQWTTAANIVTNGPFVLESRAKGSRSVFLRNTLYPADVNDTYGGNIERVSVAINRNAPSRRLLYQKNQIDLFEETGSDTSTLFAELPEAERDTIIDPFVVYMGFAYDKPPFDKVEVRRAFSAAIDRKTITKLPLLTGLPMEHLMPPGIIGASPIDEAGIGDKDNPGFDPDYARKQFAEAGYADCKNFPAITFMTEGEASTVAAVKTSITKVLGCDPGKIQVEITSFDRLLRLVSPTSPSAQRPNLFTLAWSSDYPDAKNWMADLLGCKSVENMSKRPCSDAIDKKIEAASVEFDPEKRAQLYGDLETLMFGESGEFPIAPLYVSVSHIASKPWYTAFFSTDGQYGDHWDSQKIDQAAQLAARNKTD